MGNKSWPVVPFEAVPTDKGIEFGVFDTTGIAPGLEDLKKIYLVDAAKTVQGGLLAKIGWRLCGQAVAARTQEQNAVNALVLHCIEQTKAACEDNYAFLAARVAELEARERENSVKELAALQNVAEQLAAENLALRAELEALKGERK